MENNTKYRYMKEKTYSQIGQDLFVKRILGEKINGIFLDGKPVAAYLLYNLWPGNWEVTVFKDKNFANENIVTFTRCSRRMIEHISRLDNVRRLQITVRNDNPYALRWAELIGFSHEAFLEAYAPDGCDAHIFKRLNHGIHSTSSRTRRRW